MFNSISIQEKVEFTKNLAVMVKSGIPINEALGALAEQTKSRAFAKILAKLKTETESGTSLAQGFGKEEKTFGKIFTTITEVGEASGTLDENLQFLADWLERSHDLKQEISAATLYPKFVIFVTGMLGGGLSVFILPKLVPLFEQLQVDLPLTTQLLLGFSVFLQKFWLAALLGIIVGVINFNILSRLRPIKRVLHFMYLKTPFLGSITKDLQLALINQLFFTLFKSGISISETLNVSGKAATNVYYQETIEKIKKRVSLGTTVASAMSDFPKLYPKIMTNIIATGEKSGTLDNAFAYLTEFYAKEVKNKTKKLPTIIEPLLLVFIAIMVGFVALSIIMPIYELTRGISR